MTNRELKEQVLNALDWEPSIDAGEIDVWVEENVVSILGVPRVSFRPVPGDPVFSTT